MEMVPGTTEIERERERERDRWTLMDRKGERPLIDVDNVERVCKVAPNKEWLGH